MQILEFVPHRSDSGSDRDAHDVRHDNRHDHDGHADLVIFFHGFPAVRSRQNRELAERVSQINSVCTVVPLYAGLGFSNGEFRFSSCLHEVREWTLDFIKRKRNAGWRGRLKFVGHSWGGFLSLLLANEPTLRPLLELVILMSPLLYFAPTTLSLAAFETTQRDNPHLQLGSIESLAQDFAKVAQMHPSAELIRGLNPELSVLYWQACIDQLTPPEVAERMRPLFNCRLQFELVDQDHSFLKNRTDLIHKLALGLA